MTFSGSLVEPHDAVNFLAIGKGEGKPVALNLMLHFSNSDWVTGRDGDHVELNVLDSRGLLNDLVFQLLSISFYGYLLPDVSCQLVYFGKGDL